MSGRFSLFFRVFIGFCLPLCAYTAAPSREQLIEILFASPNFVDAQLSPTGRHLASISYYEGKRSVVVLDLATPKLTGVTVGSGEDVDSIQWIVDDQIVFHVSQWEIYTRGVFVYSVSRDTSRRILDPQESGLIYAGIVDPLLHKKDMFVFEASNREYTNPPNLYLMDLSTDSARLIARNNGNIHHYVVDAEGTPLYAIESRNDVGRVLRRDAGGNWTEADAVPGSIRPVGMLPGNRYMLVSVLGPKGCNGVNLLDMQTGGFPEEPRFVPGYDIFAANASSLITDNLNGYTVGVHYHQAKPVNFWFDSAASQIESFLRRSFTNQVLDYLGVNPESSCMYFTVSSDTLPPAIIQIDMQNSKISTVYRQYPKAYGIGFMPMEPVSFDNGGAKLHGYLTRPAEPGPHPVVILVHGGPATRDTWRFNPQVQLLALSGYAVLQINYRGSTGYGLAHRLDSLGEVADLATTDIVSGANWLIEQGIADPDRIAVMGGSFGGYISLAAATRAPDLFRAVISYAGVYDLNSMHKRDKRKGFHWVDDFYVDSDPEKYASLSPINHAAEIKAPVLIVHGKSDMRVSVDQAKRMAKALRNSGRDVDTLFISWGVHGLPEEEDRKEYFMTVLSFLEKHLAEVKRSPEK